MEPYEPRMRTLALRSLHSVATAGEGWGLPASSQRRRYEPSERDAPLDAIPKTEHMVARKHLRIEARSKLDTTSSTRCPLVLGIDRYRQVSTGIESGGSWGGPGAAFGTKVSWGH